MSYTFYLNQDPAAFSDLPSYEQLSVIYDDIELAIIFDWAQLERTDPLRDVVADAEQALENDIDECREDEPIVDSTGQIRLLCVELHLKVIRYLHRKLIHPEEPVWLKFLSFSWSSFSYCR